MLPNSEIVSKEQERLEQIISEYEYIFIDTCSLMGDAISKFIGNVVPLLLKYGKNISIIDQVNKEIDKNSKKDNIATSLQAGQADLIRKFLLEKQLLKVYTIVISGLDQEMEHDTFADSKFLSIFLNLLGHRICFVTQDSALTRDVQSFNKLESVKGMQLDVMYINSFGYLKVKANDKMGSTSEAKTAPVYSRASLPRASAKLRLSDQMMNAITLSGDKLTEEDWLFYFDDYEILQGPEIIYHAFEYRSDIINVNIPDGVTSIGDYAFNECKNLTNVTIPGSVTSIEYHAFSECKNLTSVTIPDGVTDISSGTFFLCRALTSVKIPDSVTSIGQAAFNTCSSLTNFTIPDGVTTIGEAAFTLCSSLTNITIPDNVTTIGEGAFDMCDNLTSLTIGDNVTSIGAWAFCCDNLTSLTIADSVTGIGDEAFRRDRVTSITIIETSKALDPTYVYNYFLHKCPSANIVIKKTESL